MNLRQSSLPPLLRAASAIIAAALLAGSVSAGDQASLQASMQAPEQGAFENALLADAAAALGEIAERQAWIAASTEYADALTAVGRRDEAVALLSTAHNASFALGAEDQLKAGVAIAQSLAAMDAAQEAGSVYTATRAIASQIENAVARQDALAKLATSMATLGRLDEAYNQIATLPQDEEGGLASIKARAFRELANVASEQSDFATAQKAIKAITFGLPYYSAIARSDVAQHAVKAQRPALARELLEQAERLARADTDGYFGAGALRDVAEGWSDLGERSKALSLFKDAVELTDKARSPQHKARAISRIATVMADAGLAEESWAYLEESISTNRTETSDVMRRYSFYEIAGSAAFVGDFETALALIDEVPDEKFGSAGSLRAAALRDLAWGQARYGDIEQAAQTARSIGSPRERVQALCRIVRLIRNPEMDAFARYL